MSAGQAVKLKVNANSQSSETLLTRVVPRGFSWGMVLSLRVPTKMGVADKI